jgi:hypothetical protein
MVYEGLTSKEKASVFLGAMLRKLPSTRSGKGLFIAREDRHKIILVISDSLARIVYSAPDKDGKANLWLEQEEFRVVVETLLFARLISLPRATWFHNYFTSTDAVNEFVKSVISELDSCGLFGNIAWIKESPMSAVSKVAKALRQVASGSKWLECR